MRTLLVFLTVLSGFGSAAGAAQPAPGEPVTVALRPYNGRPVVFVNDKPLPLPMYSPVGFSTSHFQGQMPWFAPHKMGAYFLFRPSAPGEGWGASQFWQGDSISNTPIILTVEKGRPTYEEQLQVFDKLDPDAWFFVRDLQSEPPLSWKKLHPDLLFVTEEGKTTDTPSLASDLYWDSLAKVAAAQIEYVEAQPWGNRVLGYWCGMFGEGTFGPLGTYNLYDHSAPMQEKWRAFLKNKYATVEALRAAWKDPALTFETVAVPKDPLLGPQRQMAALTYWQAAAVNQPRRDYLELNGRLLRAGYAKIIRACAEACGGRKLCLYDAFKMPMQGWNLAGFFDTNISWWPAYPELMSGGGYLDMASLFNIPGFDGLVTPHDYQARGMGGVYEPEGIVDSMILRGKFFLSEMDLRTYNNPPEDYGSARNDREYAAISWRNFATSFTRGFSSYWMDLCGNTNGWFGNPGIQSIIARQVEVVRESIDWKHEDVPGIAVILDDSAVLETNGSGNYFNEAIMWEFKMGLARCGVPYRIYLLDDLKLPNFPKHRVFYFPNLFKVDDARLALLKEKVFGNGSVVLWGPGSGISDGIMLSTNSASRLTGFQFEPLLPGNVQHRVLMGGSPHPITAGMQADTVIGGPLAYGPSLYPKDGATLGVAWTQQGRNYAGLAVKEFGKGAGAGKGPGDWASVFVTAVPVPADLWRNLARYAGAHVYSDSGDVLMADSTIVALHSIQPGAKQIRLPGVCRVWDVVTGKLIAKKTDIITFTLESPDTRVFRLEPLGKP
jgi:hypothetical protein